MPETNPETEQVEVQSTNENPSETAEESNPYLDEIKALHAEIEDMKKQHSKEITDLIKSINGQPKDTRTAEEKMADEVIERINKNRR